MGFFPPTESFPRLVMGLTMLMERAKNLAPKVKNTLALHKGCESSVGIPIRKRFLTHNRCTGMEEPSKRQKYLDKKKKPTQTTNQHSIDPDYLNV